MIKHFLVLFIAALVGLVFLIDLLNISKNMEKDEQKDEQKEVQQIIDNYVAQIKKDQGLSAGTKLKLEYELKNIGYGKVEVEFAETANQGEYIFLISMYRRNIFGNFCSPNIIEKDVKIDYKSLG